MHYGNINYSFYDILNVDFIFKLVFNDRFNVLTEFWFRILNKLIIIALSNQFRLFEKIYSLIM